MFRALCRSRRFGRFCLPSELRCHVLFSQRRPTTLPQPGSMASVSQALGLSPSAGSLEVETERPILSLSTACARQQGRYFLGKVLHLILDLLALEATFLKPCVEREILVATAFLDSHYLRGHFRRRPEQRHFLLQKQRRIDFFRRIEFLLIRIGEYRGKAERAVIVPLHFERFLVAFQFAFAIVAGKDHMHVGPS